MNERMSVANCSWCKKQIECPENMLNSDKHICFDCFKKHESELDKLPEGKLHIDFPRKEFEARMPEIMAQALAEEVFPKMWSENKVHFKHFNKKELSKNMFISGALAALESIKEMEQEDEDAG